MANNKEEVEYTTENKIRGITYLVTLIIIQAISIYFLITYRIYYSPLLFILLAIIIAFVFPIVLAIALFKLG